MSYKVFRRLDDGEFLDVGSRAELEQAAQLAEAFNQLWPGEYVIRDADGNQVIPQ